MNKSLTKDAIILAGGLGTRLRSEIGEFPKALAPDFNRQGRLKMNRWVQ